MFAMALHNGDMVILYLYQHFVIPITTLDGSEPLIDMHIHCCLMTISENSHRELYPKVIINMGISYEMPPKPKDE